MSENFPYTIDIVSYELLLRVLVPYLIVREGRNRRLLPRYGRIELLLLLLLVLLLQDAVQVGAVRVEGVDVAAAAMDDAADGHHGLGDLAVAHLAAHHAAGRML